MLGNKMGSALQSNNVLAMLLSYLLPSPVSNSVHQGCSFKLWTRGQVPNSTSGPGHLRTRFCLNLALAYYDFELSFIALFIYNIIILCLFTIIIIIMDSLLTFMLFLSLHSTHAYQLKSTPHIALGIVNTPECGNFCVFTIMNYSNIIAYTFTMIGAGNTGAAGPVLF